MPLGSSWAANTAYIYSYTYLLCATYLRHRRWGGGGAPCPWAARGSQTGRGRPRWTCGLPSGQPRPSRAPKMKMGWADGDFRG